MIRSVQLDDAERIEKIALESQIDFTRDQILSSMKLPSRRLLVFLSEEDELLGFLHTEEVLGEAEIIDIAVTIQARRQGIAQSLIESWLNQLDNFSSVFLEVRESNLAAIHLYQKLGFQEIGIRKNYYANREDARLMQLHFDRKGEEFENPRD